MSLFVVRHGHAVSRQTWMTDDRERPLDDKGFAQAQGLIDVLAPHRIEHVVSSPAARCLQTVAPLAEARGLDVVEDPALFEAAPLAGLRQMVAELDHAVLCSHGDLIPELVDHLIAEGMEAVGRDCKKASTWVLERRGARVVRGTYLPPPPA